MDQSKCPECGEALMVDLEGPEGIVYICPNTHRTVWLEAA